jgi:hypothetical protein
MNGFQGKPGAINGVAGGSQQNQKKSLTIQTSQRQTVAEDRNKNSSIAKQTELHLKQQYNQSTLEVNTNNM